MDFQRHSNQLHIVQKPLGEIQNNTRKYYPDMRRNKLCLPPLMQIRPVTGKVNSVQFMTKPQVASVSKQDSMNQSELVNRNRIASVPSVQQSIIKDNPDPTAISVADSIAGFNVPGRSNAGPKRNSENSESNSFNFRIFGSTENEKMFIFTGTVERVIKWNKIFRNHFCYYEVIASVISIQEGSVNTQKIMLLRDRKGPILQVIYYNTTHIDINDFHVEQVLRCLGRMSSPNILNAVSIRNADQEEVETLQRLCLACDQAISHFLSV